MSKLSGRKSNLLAQAIGLSLVFSAIVPVAHASKTRTGEADEATTQSVGDEAVAQTAKIQASLPALGDEATATNKTKEQVDRWSQALLNASMSAAQSAQASRAASNATTGAEIEDQLKRDFLNNGLSAGVEAVRATGLPFLGQLQGGITYGATGLDIGLKALGRLIGDGDGHHLLAQGGIHNEGDRPTLNLGIIYRYVDEAGKRLYGANTFYDHDFDNGSNRVGLGVDAASETLRGFGNVYIPLSDTWNDVDGNPLLQERAASGRDVGITVSPESVPGLDLQLKSTWWDGDRVDVFGDGRTVKDPNVWSAKIGYQPISLVGVSLEHEKASSGVDDTKVMVNLNYQFGKPLEQQVQRGSAALRNDIQARALAFVEREDRIVMEQRDKFVPMAFAGPGVINASIREDEVYNHTMQVTGGVGAPAMSLTGTDAALFTLTGTLLQLDATRLPKHVAGGDNTYEVTVVANDGRTTAQQSFVIVVNPVDTDGDGLEDGREEELGTDAGKADTDGDGINDGQEVTDGTDPLDPHDPVRGAINAPTAVTVLADGAALSGPPIVGSTLSVGVTCSGDGVCPVLKYQWEIETAPNSGTYEPIAGATASTYVVKNTDQMRRIRVAVAK